MSMALLLSFKHGRKTVFKHKTGNHQCIKQPAGVDVMSVCVHRAWLCLCVAGVSLSWGKMSWERLFLEDGLTAGNPNAHQTAVRHLAKAAAAVKWRMIHRRSYLDVGGAWQCGVWPTDFSFLQGFNAVALNRFLFLWSIRSISHRQVVHCISPTLYKIISKGNI